MDDASGSKRDRADRTAVLVLRILREQESPDGLHVRLRGTPDLDSCPESVTVARSKSDVAAAVRVWLEAALEGPRQDT
jgi:hypothetical protein